MNRTNQPKETEIMTTTTTLDNAYTTLRADGYSPQWTGDGSLYVPVGAGDDDALQAIRQLLGDGYRADWTGDGNTDADGDSTDDVGIEVVE